MSDRAADETVREALVLGPLRRWGPVAAVVVAFVIFAAGHHLTRLRGFDYTWLRPPRTAYSILRKEDFPSAAFVVFLLGLSARPNAWRTLRETWARIRAAAGGDARPYVKPVLGNLALGVAFVLVASRLSNAFTLLDFVALLIFGAVVDVRMGGGRTWLGSALPTALYSMAALTFVSYGFTVVKAIVFVRHAPLDDAIVAAETAMFGQDPSAAVAAWASARPWAVSWSSWIYYHSFDHLLLQLVFLAALGDREERARYIAAMCLTYVVGGLAYHLVPSLGPIYHAPSRYAYLEPFAKSAAEYRGILAEHVQRVIGGKGGDLVSYEYVAAMPSLHVAQEAVMTFHARRSTVMFAASGAFLAATMLAVVVLGWHYPSDCVAGLLVAASAIAMTRVLRERGLAWRR